METMGVSDIIAQLRYKILWAKLGPRKLNGSLIKWTDICCPLSLSFHLYATRSYFLGLIIIGIFHIISWDIDSHMVLEVHCHPSLKSTSHLF